MNNRTMEKKTRDFIKSNSCIAWLAIPGFDFFLAGKFSPCCPAAAAGLLDAYEPVGHVFRRWCSSYAMGGICGWRLNMSVFPLGTAAYAGAAKRRQGSALSLST